MPEAFPPIYVSGVHSGPSPAAGVGIARCLRSAFPEARPIAVDYFPLSSGLNWPDFDGLRCFPDWDSLDLASHAETVRALVASGGLWLSARDCEVRWIASALGDVRGIPNPPASALDIVQKPAAAAAAILGLLVPPWATLDDEGDLHTFCRRAGWDVWVKGRTSDATHVDSWRGLHAAAGTLAGAVGGRDGVFVQRHIPGRGEAVAFCAHSGMLLGAIVLIRRVDTDDGKVWTGDVLPASSEVDAMLRRFVAGTRWTGGGEIEVIRDPGGSTWLIEINPRFPAWIYAGALAGMNLPALLVAAELGIEPPRSAAAAGSFTRAVTEIPIRDEVAAILRGRQP